jgi:hypothetical protein
MQLIQALEALGTHLNATIPTPDSKGIYKLVFDENLQLEFKPLKKERFLVSASIAIVPSADKIKRDFFKELLQVNFSIITSIQQTLAFDKNQNELILYQIFQERELDRSKFIVQCENFLNNLAFWGRIVNDTENSNQVSPSPYLVP